ncbi:MAG: serine--tRNA ligase [bacterium]|nr:serine--tRNA ligase [bacterium]
MLDIQFIRDNSELVSEKSRQKGYQVDIPKLVEIDNERRDLLQQVEALRARRNDNADKIKNGRPEQNLIDKGKQIKIELSERERYLGETEGQFTELLKSIPNMPLDDVPAGSSEDENQVVYEVGDKPQFDFEPKNHAELAEARLWLDKERAAKVAGARFAYIKGDLVKLQFALMNWITDVLTNEVILRQIADNGGLTDVSSKPFTPILPPLMLKTYIYEGMDRLEPKEDRYKIEGEELWLQGSAEHVLGSMHANEVFQAIDLPIRYLGFATSFRKEAGTYGKDMEGLIRMHQFDKLEMESFTSSAKGLNEHLFLIAIQEYILLQLKLPYRKLLKCTFDIGKPNARGVDMDVWLPAQNKYRETHTADYMTDYQARRLKIKLKEGDQTEFVHTNDATALALGRGMVGIIENYQTIDGRVIVPEVLRDYMGGKDLL